MKIFLSMFVSFFATVVAIRLMDRVFGGKPDELLTLVMGLLIAIAAGLECAVLMVKKQFGLDQDLK